MNEFIVFIIQFGLGIVLFFITNWIGRHSYSVGYMEISMFVKAETAPAFNFVFRVVSPVIYIIIVSVIFYKLTLDELVKNIYLVCVYYIVFRILFNLITNRAILLNWRRQIIYMISIIVLSFITYESFIKYKKNILPDFNSISNELWIIILLFLFQVLNNLSFSSEDTKKRKENYLKNRYFKFKNLYNNIITSLTKNRKIEALAYTIIIYEDFNRPKVARFVENLKFRITKKPMTLGVMQIRSSKLINDFKSVENGVIKLINDLKEVIKINKTEKHDKYREWKILHDLIEKYNGGQSYNSEVSDLFKIIWSRFYKEQYNKFNFED